MDSELAGLDLAVAKAVGKLNPHVWEEICLVSDEKGNELWFKPTRDIAEAMRLAAERNLLIDFNAEHVLIVQDSPSAIVSEYYSNHSGDKLRACCVAICRAVIASKESEGG